MNDEQFAHFLVNGFAVFRDDEFLAKIHPDELEFPIVSSKRSLPDIQQCTLPSWLHEASKYFLTKYIVPVFPHSTELQILYWNGVEIGATNWHSDLLEGYDLTVLVYLDTMRENTGGAIHFRSGGVGDICVYPSAGDIVCFTQANDVEHRADDTTVPRRVIAFEYRRHI